MYTYSNGERNSFFVVFSSLLFFVISISVLYFTCNLWITLSWDKHSVRRESERKIKLLLFYSCANILANIANYYAKWNKNCDIVFKFPISRLFTINRINKLYVFDKCFRYILMCNIAERYILNHFFNPRHLSRGQRV